MQQDEPRTTASKQVKEAVKKALELLLLMQLMGCCCTTSLAINQCALAAKKSVYVKWRIPTLKARGQQTTKITKCSTALALMIPLVPTTKSQEKALSSFNQPLISDRAALLLLSQRD
jgi:hypothetical protein